MANKWKPSQLSEVVDIHTGKVSVNEADLVTYISTDNLLPDFGGVVEAEKMPTSGKVTSYKVGDILFSNIRTYFKKLWLADQDGSCSNDVIVFRPKNGIVSEYIYHLLMNQEFIEYTVKTSKGTKMPRGDKDAIMKYEFSLAPDSERLKIGNSLIQFKSKIDLNRQTNQTLEQMAQALFKSWFVDFEPVFDNAIASGMAVNDFPEALQKKAEQRQQVQQQIANGEPSAGKELDAKPLPEDIHQLFPSEFEQTGDQSIGINGWIPKEWEPKVLSDLLDVKYGKDHKKLDEGSYPVYGSGGLMRNVDKFLYEGESVLIPRKGTLTNIMYVNETFWTVDTMFFTKPKMNNVAKFSFYLLKRLDFNNMNVGSAVPSMTTKVLNALQVVYPSENALAKFDELVELYFSKTRANNENTKQLEKLRVTLLPKLISGEIELSNNHKEALNG